MRAEFDETLITGNEMIDSQHKELIGKINGLLDSCEDGNDKLAAVKTLDYLAEGNDRMYALRDNLSKKVTKIFVRDLIMESIRRAAAQGRKITARLEGRIVKQ